MDEVKRLQQLAGLNEIKVNRPINKKEVFNYFLDNNKLIMITNFIDEDLETVINASGEDSLEEYAEYHEIDPNMIKSFYDSNLNNEVGYTTMEKYEDAQKLENLSNYKNIYAQGDENEYVYIIGNNL